MRCRSIFLLIGICLSASVRAAPWIEIAQDQAIHKGLDIPTEELHKKSDRYLGNVFEERFKFYRIYHSRQSVDPGPRQQVVKGRTHFTARPMTQYVQVVRIRITPEQERWLKEKGIQRQDVIRARVRFAGIAPGGALAFDLLEVLER